MPTIEVTDEMVERAFRIYSCRTAWTPDKDTLENHKSVMRRALDAALNGPVIGDVKRCAWTGEEWIPVFGDIDHRGISQGLICYRNISLCGNACYNPSPNTRTGKERRCGNLIVRTGVERCKPK